MKTLLQFPGESVTPWMGGMLHKFDFNGREAWVVEPPAYDEWIDRSNWNDSMHTIANPVPFHAPKRWFWLPEWPDAFPERNGVKELLALGFHMIHIHVYDLCGNPEAMEVMKNFYDYLRTLDFAEKGALIGMSLGGLYSFRFAATFPEIPACIYADAPVCDIALKPGAAPERLAMREKAWGKNLENHPLAPVNNFLPIVKAKIPVLLIMGNDDQTLEPARHGELFAKRFAEAGGSIEVLRRPCWGHHPHGLPDPFKIVRFILRHVIGL